MRKWDLERLEERMLDVFHWRTVRLTAGVLVLLSLANELGFRIGRTLVGGEPEL